MGEALGIPEWLAATIIVVGAISFLFALAWRNTKRQIVKTGTKRPNPTRSEFMQLMETDVSAEASAFLWDTALPYLEFFSPPITPHPDDDLVKDLPINGDDFAMDWPREWAELREFHESNLPDWPSEWPVTIRSYGKWLDMGPV